jgi:hypothetical protein
MWMVCRVLERIAEEHSNELARYTVFITAMIDNIDSMSLSQFRQVIYFMYIYMVGKIYNTMVTLPEYLQSCRCPNIGPTPPPPQKKNYMCSFLIRQYLLLAHPFCLFLPLAFFALLTSIFFFPFLSPEGVGSFQIFSHLFRSNK